METQKQSIKSLILTYGAILAVTTILISVVKYAMGKHLERSAWDSILGIALMIALIVYPIMQLKKENNSLLSISQSLNIGLGVAAISGVISVLYFFAFANYIEPDFAKDIMDAQISEAIKENPNLSSEDLEKGKEVGIKFVMPMMYGGIVVMNLILGFIISLIAGLAMKKE